MHETWIFIDMVFMVFNALILASFPFAKELLKLLLGNGVGLYSLISSWSFNFIFDKEFPFKGKRKKFGCLVGIEDVAFAQFCVSPKILN